MDVRCDKCQARYRIDDARVGAAGLTMRCGKCGNTFKVSKDSGAAAPASKPPPEAAPADLPGSTMMFQAPKIPPKAALPSAPPPAAAPAAGSPMVAKPTDEAAGSTMMFQAPKIPPRSVPAPVPKPAPAGGDEDSGSTMAFGTAPLAMPKPAPVAAPSAPPKPASISAKPTDEAAGSTMMFGVSPAAAKSAPGKAPPIPASKPPSTPGKLAPAAPKPPTPAPKPAPAPAPVQAKAPEPLEEAPGPEPEPEADPAAEPAPEEAAPPDTDESAPQDQPAEEQQPDEPRQAKPGEVVGDDEIDPAAMTGEVLPMTDVDDIPHPPPRKKPLPKMVIYGGIGGGVVIVIGIVAAVLFFKFREQKPSTAALQALAASRALLDKDALSMFPQSLETEQSAAAASPRSPFGEAHALHAEIEVTWSDALADEAALLSDKALHADNDKTKSDADAASQKAAADALIHFKAAFEAARVGLDKAPNSAEVHLALADYYRAAKSSNYDREIKRAALLKADAGRIEALEGEKLLGEDDGAEKALPKLKAALAANPQSAHVQYMIAQAQAQLKNDAETKAALIATLKLSPTHERAKLMLEAFKGASGGDANSPPSANRPAAPAPKPAPAAPAPATPAKAADDAPAKADATPAAADPAPAKADTAAAADPAPAADDKK